MLATRGSAPFRRAPGTSSRASSSRSRSAAIRGSSDATACRARAAAAPKPTMPATFSVPARRFRSCAPPRTSGAIFVPRRT